MKTVVSNLLLMTLVIGILSGFVTEPATTDLTTTESSVGGAYLLFAGKNGGNIRKSEMRGQTELSVDGCAKGSKIFTFALEVRDGGKVKTLQAKSNSLSKEMVAALDGLDVGDSFAFKSTQAYLPDGKDIVDVHSERFVLVQDKTSTSR